MTILKGFVKPPLKADFRSMMFYFRNAHNLNKSESTSREMETYTEPLPCCQRKIYKDRNKTSLKRRTSEPAPDRIKELTI